MNFYTSSKKYKIKLFFLILLVLLTIFYLFDKSNWKENLAQDIRIQTCQPNFTSTKNSQLFKVKRLFYGLVNTFKYGCNYEKLKININFKNFEIIKDDRLVAIQNGVLTNPTEVPATIIHKNKKYRADVRLKGDLINHWGVNKQWSLKIELKKGKSINGMKEFSITKLIERRYPDNLIIAKQFERFGIISPKFKIYKADVNGQNWGLMLAEEQFSNVFLEKRNLKDSLIFKLTNETKFKISKYFYKKNIEKREIFLNKLGKLEVDIFNKKKIKKYNYLKNHETIIKSINEKIILSNKTQEKNFVKKHFHVEKLAKTLATVVAFNSFHSINLLNLRFYLNPYTLNIEPIPTDNAYNLNANIENNYKKKLLNLSFIFTSLYDDEEFKFLFGQSLKQIKSDLNQIESDNFELCKNFESYCQRKINIENISDNLSKLIEIGDNIFTNTQEESNNIEKFDYSNISSTEQELSALKLFDNYIYARLFNNELNIYNNTLDEILIKNITLYSDDVQNSCKIYNKKNCNQKKYSINFNLSNQKYLEPQRILLKNDKKFIWAKINAKIKDYSFDYILRNEDKYFVTELFNKNNNEINSNLKKISEDTFLISGKVFIQNPIIVPVGYNLKIQPNSEVILNKNSYIYINGGNFISDGTDGKITFKPLNDTWGGIYVRNSNDLSIINNTEIISTKNFEHKGIFLTGGVNFYESDVKIIKSYIQKNKSEDAINIINSNFELRDSEIKNTTSDGIDSDFSNGLIINSFFKNIGGDAIDTSGSKISVKNTNIYNVGDKGISAGESSNLYLENIQIDSSEFGIVSKDLSIIKGKEINITNSFQYDYMAFEKKNHFGPGLIDLKNIEGNTKSLSQKESVITINDKKVESKNFNPKVFY